MKLNGFPEEFITGSEPMPTRPHGTLAKRDSEGPEGWFGWVWWVEWMEPTGEGRCDGRRLGGATRRKDMVNI